MCVCGHTVPMGITKVLKTIHIYLFKFIYIIYLLNLSSCDVGESLLKSMYC